MTRRALGFATISARSLIQWLVAGDWWITKAGASRRQSEITSNESPITSHQNTKPRSIGTPITAGLLTLAGFDRVIRHHDVRGLIDFPFPCRTVSTQVLLYGERISCVQRPHNFLGQCRTTAELPSDGVPPKTSRPGVDRFPERVANV